jgi:16S rRNA C967 or C1407 C5-methylase (RsmB/RsmF family)
LSIPHVFSEFCCKDAHFFLILQAIMQLPDDFTQLIRPIFGEERFARFFQALDEEPPVSIRVNPRIIENGKLRIENYDYSHPSTADRNNDRQSNHNCQFPIPNSQFSKVPWCPNAFYLSTRPNFTFDPLLHAGCYYVQEASSMFLDEVLRQHLPDHPVMALDLCAAPGGKSTLMRSALPEGSVLYSNEPVRKRASILQENVEKWGYDQHFVTCCYPKDYRRSKMKFDIILCDVPCSGEGMFRKDPDSIKEWSLQNVDHCQQLQREIVADAWECLADGGLLVYSTCTYNTKEDEENVRWIVEEFGAEVLPVDIKAEWGITGSLLQGFQKPVYRFIPGYTRGEGLFMAAMRKKGRPTPNPSLLREGSSHTRSQKSTQNLNVLTTPLAQQGGAGGEASSLSYSDAIAYLRGEALVLPPDTPRGLVEVCFLGHPLGLVKNIGSRANNLYPKEWRIKTTHVPDTYSPVLPYME